MVNDSQLEDLENMVAGGDREAGRILLKRYFALPAENLEKRKKVILDLEQIFREDPPFRRYQYGRLCLIHDLSEQGLEVLSRLAYSDLFAPAQWYLGRLIVYQKVTEFSFDRGVDLLEAAARSGHKRAPVTLSIARLRRSSGAQRIIHAVSACFFATRFRFYWNIAKNRGHDMQ